MKQSILKTSIILLLLCCTANIIRAQEKIDCKGSGELCDFFRHYIAVFNDRDWKGFSACLSDEITVMFDSRNRPDRKNGRTEVEQMFRFLFPEPGTPLDPNRFKIIPVDLLIQDLGDAAVISFVMKDTAQIARRSLVLQKKNNQWQIVHIHASSFDITGK